MALSAALVAGCAAPDYSQVSPQPVPQTYPAQSYPVQSYPVQAPQQPYTAAYGTIESIQMVRTSDTGGVGWGTVAGGVVGGLLGSQIGSGTGKTAATVAGAVGGAAVGSSMQDRTKNVYQIGVRLDNGSFVTITQDTVADLQIGSRVRIDNNNRVYRY
jgi:outer membrane lipoprotein SlyB